MSRLGAMGLGSIGQGLRLNLPSAANLAPRLGVTRPTETRTKETRRTDEVQGEVPSGNPPAHGPAHRGGLFRRRASDRRRGGRTAEHHGEQRGGRGFGWKPSERGRGSDTHRAEHHGEQRGGRAFRRSVSDERDPTERRGRPTTSEQSRTERSRQAEETRRTSTGDDQGPPGKFEPEVSQLIRNAEQQIQAAYRGFDARRQALQNETTRLLQEGRGKTIPEKIAYMEKLADRYRAQAVQERELTEMHARTVEDITENVSNQLVRYAERRLLHPDTADIRSELGKLDVISQKFYGYRPDTGNVTTPEEYARNVGLAGLGGFLPFEAGMGAVSQAGGKPVWDPGVLRGLFKKGGPAEGVLPKLEPGKMTLDQMVDRYIQAQNQREASRQYLTAHIDRTTAVANQRRADMDQARQWYQHGQQMAMQIRTLGETRASALESRAEGLEARAVNLQATDVYEQQIKMTRDTMRLMAALGGVQHFGGIFTASNTLLGGIASNAASVGRV